MDINEIKKNTTQLSLLFVEDDEGLRNKTAMIFSNLFKQIDTAANGAEGLSMFENAWKTNGGAQAYDLVITDVNMPKMDGIQMCEKIMEINPAQTIIIISAHNESEYLHQAINLGVFGFLTKPIEYERFLQAVDRASRLVLNEKMKDQLIEQERMRSIQQLLSSIAHHWRQPLNVISIQADLLMEAHGEGEMTDQDFTKTLSKIKDVTQQLSLTINSFSKVFDRHHTNMRFEVKDILELASDIIVPELASESIQLTTDIENTFLEGNKEELTKILLSILHNAKESVLRKKEKENTHTGEITITSTLENSDTVIKITDNGVGMNEEVLKQIFEPYYTTKFQASGIGISLYYAKRYIEMEMGGRLSAASIEGEGAVFEMHLPCSTSSSNV